MALDLSNVEALCFDVDGTLRDTDDQFVERLVRMLKPVRFLFPKQDPHPFARKLVMMIETPGNFLFGIPDRLGIDDEIAAVGDYMYRRGSGKSHKPFVMVPGVKEALLVLKPHFKMSVVSARGGPSTKGFLDQFELGSFFECVATARTCERTKPHPDPILWAAEQMDVTAEKCLMIGDTIVDILAAKAAGAQSVGVLCGFGEQEELQNAGADLILMSTDLLPKHLLNSQCLGIGQLKPTPPLDESPQSV